MIFTVFRETGGLSAQGGRRRSGKEKREGEERKGEKREATTA